MTTTTTAIATAAVHTRLQLPLRRWRMVVVVGIQFYQFYALEKNNRSGSSIVINRRRRRRPNVMVAPLRLQLFLDMLHLAYKR